MPTYEYTCQKCNTIFEKKMTVADKSTTKIRCPECNAEDVLRFGQSRTCKKTGDGDVSGDCCGVEKPYKMLLDEKTRELIAVGAAIAGNCLPCLTYHFQKCRELGISVEEIDEAIETAKTVKEVPVKKIYELACSLLKKEEKSDE